MKDEILLELYKTQEGRFEILKEILKQDNFSIARIVEAKETALTEKLSENSIFISGLAMRSTVMFGLPKDVLKMIDQVKPLVAEDILKSGVIKGTEMEKQLLAQYPSILA